MPMIFSRAHTNSNFFWIRWKINLLMIIINNNEFSLDYIPLPTKIVIKHNFQCCFMVKGDREVICSPARRAPWDPWSRTAWKQARSLRFPLTEMIAAMAGMSWRNHFSCLSMRSASCDIFWFIHMQVPTGFSFFFFLFKSRILSLLESWHGIFIRAANWSWWLCGGLGGRLGCPAFSTPAPRLNKAHG